MQHYMQLLSWLISGTKTSEFAQPPTLQQKGRSFNFKEVVARKSEQQLGYWSVRASLSFTVCSVNVGIGHHSRTTAHKTLANKTITWFSSSFHYKKLGRDIRTFDGEPGWIIPVEKKDLLKRKFWQPSQFAIKAQSQVSIKVITDFHNPMLKSFITSGQLHVWYTILGGTKQARRYYL